MILKCSDSSMSSAFARLSEKYSVYLPTDEKTTGGAKFSKWENSLPWSRVQNTVKGPKDFFFPQSEDLMRFRLEGKSIEIMPRTPSAEDFILFGVRPCDVKSLDVLDRVFLSDPVDSFYSSRREHGVIISTACSAPSETCFCTAFGILPWEPSGDAVTWRTEDTVFWEAMTPKGKEVLSLLDDILEECDGAEVEKQKSETRRIMERHPLSKLTADSFGGDVTEKLFGSEKWKQLSEACLGCGACTFVCPTCQCYDIKDLDTGNGVVRFRLWDSCMYSEFTKMAHGNNRTTQLERFRQRFMHKLVYYPANNDGLFGCVGCGRCISSCPVSMNTVKVMKALGGKTDE